MFDLNVLMIYIAKNGVIIVNDGFIILFFLNENDFKRHCQ